MATIKATFNQFTSGVGSQANSAGDRISTLISGIVGQAKASIGSLITGSVVGINVNKIDEMRNSIKTYVNDIETHLDNVYVNTDPKAAFADPDMQVAVKEYIGGIMEVCRAYTSQLLKFSDMLKEIQDDYIAKQAAQADTLRGAAGEVKDTVERYQEQY